MKELLKILLEGLSGKHMGFIEGIVGLFFPRGHLHINLDIE